MGRRERKKSGSKGGGSKMITFDENARKDYLTGFRKRKNERKQLSRQKIAEQVRQDKIEARAEKKATLQATRSVGLSGDADEDDAGADGDGDGDDDDDDDDVPEGS
eukprot:3329126-Prymnesium_polylepis.1